MKLSDDEWGGSENVYVAAKISRTPFGWSFQPIKKAEVNLL